MNPDLLTVHRLISPCADPRRPRDGKLCLHDTHLAIWEEDVDEKKFRPQTFLPLIDHLKRKGWTVSLDPDIVKHYACLSPNRRICRRGPLEATLELGGRTLKFEIYVAGADRDHGGRHGFDKLQKMTSAQRMLTLGAMLSTARFIVRRHGYPVAPYKAPMNALRRGGVTSFDYLDYSNRTSGHYREALGRADWHGDDNRKSGDGVLLEHGQSVYAIDHKGRIVRGRAYFQLGRRWWVALSETLVTVVDVKELFVAVPEGLRILRNGRARRARLEGEMQKAMHGMDFSRAQLLKSILFSDAQLYRIWSDKRHAWYCTQAMGYTLDATQAGLFREDEARRQVGDCDYLKAIPVAA